ncbi:amidohydrolase [Candidatus Contubernalis alkaliaceticus]|uniref:amidohydrolase n=1 Tax=Candidatus Contubernalis alkaliaceticus TaxID=338645 RepID=UPI001F4C3198|nr:amidohydrolase [Candidatus Contubernalis alkalaceticus]UNC91205.1 amidohydrolase [Candidatus Contubernalis alkalaceticus]
MFKKVITFILLYLLALAGCVPTLALPDTDIIITNTTILTMDANSTIIENGSLVIKDDRILAIGETEDILNKYSALKIIDGANQLLMPGLVNTHTHVPMTLFRGYADDLPLQEWLYDNIFPLEAEYVTAYNVRIGTELAVAEMLRGGITTFNDMYYFIDDMAHIVEETGIRAVLSKSIIDFPVPNSPTPEDGLRIAEETFNKWNSHPRITIGFAAHAPYTCSPELIQKVKALADKYQVPFNTHLAETGVEVEQILEKYGFTPVGHLENLGVLSSNVIAAHGVHLTKDDIKILARHGVSVAHNPVSNMKLTSGVSPVPQLLEAGVKVGLGTDGAASNNNQDMFTEMRMAALLHKITRIDPTVMDAKTIVEIATIGGAKVLGMENEIGSLEVGKKADMILLDLTQPHALPLYNVYSHLVYSLKSSDVQTVIIDGSLVMENKKMLYIDEEQLNQKVQEVAEQIGTDM